MEKLFPLNLLEISLERDCNSNQQLKMVKNPKPIKKGVKTEPPQLQFDYPVFCFKNCRKGYKPSDLDSPQKRKAFLQRLTKWSEMTWEDIRGQDRQGLGHEKIPQSSIKGSLSGIGKDQVIISTYIGKKVARLIGFKTDGVFHVLWVDGKMDIYKHG